MVRTRTICQSDGATRYTPALNRSSPIRTWLALVRTYEFGSSLLATALEPLDLTLAQNDVLSALSSGDGINQQTLATRLLISKANLSGLLNRLEERALIERQESGTDARTKLVYLTPNGKRRIKRALVVQQELIESTFGQLERDDLERLGQITERLTALLEQRRTANSGGHAR